MTADFDARVLSNETIASGVSDIWIKLPERAASPRPGQFAHVSARGCFLRRPISIAGYDTEKYRVRLIIRNSGRGTAAISSVFPGETLRVLMPLGNPYPLTSTGETQNVWLAAGGMGAAPLLFAAKYMAGLGTEKFKARSFVGFRDEDSAFARGEFDECGKLCFSIGGLVTDKISEALAEEKPDMILACGPTRMLAALREICAFSGVSVHASLEERMGCGVGACLACACAVKSGGGVDYKRVCRDGPVFDLAEVELK